MSGAPDPKTTCPESAESARAQRTRNAFLSAFVSLVLDRPYDRIHIADIIDAADLGRSTFYDHFRNKDDLLIKSMSGPLAALASALDDPPDLERISFILDHFMENRRVARVLLEGAAAPLIVRALADRIEPLLTQRSADAPPAALTAHLTAESQIALVKGWLRQPDECAAEDLAATIVRSTAAITNT